VSGAWKDWIPGVGISDPIPTTGWTADGAAVTLSTASGLRAVTVATGNSGGHVRSAATTSFQVTVPISVLIPDTSGGGAVILFLEEQATGEALGVQLTGGVATNTLFVARRPNGAFSAVGQTVLQTNTPTAGVEPRVLVRLAYNAANVGTEVTLAISTDGVNFLTLLTEAKATSFTTAPDRIQYGGEGGSGNTISTMWLYDEVGL
jgi:hypothetical protein